ncbi:MAG TPA: DNA polymerase III subunit alpha [Candidatus Cloacimonadota bacterium]|nr:DNA polymerase III subunit alpha [Candidatus Cloacimonadota bacterium]
MAFVHLHNHTQYSLLDGACRVDKMISMAKDYGMTAVAMTDHGNMFGTIDFFTKAKKEGIKPIIGIETYVINHELDDPENKSDIRHHLVLLAKTLKGYKNLMKLSSKAFLEGFYYKPRVSKSLLKEYSEDIICLSACLKGEIPYLLLNDNFEKAKEVVQFYQEIYPDSFYLEIQDHGLADERQIHAPLIRLAKETGTPMVVTNDCHYLKKEDAEAHDVLLCIQTGKSLADTSRMKYNTNQLYFKNEDEMRKLFRDLPEAYENTNKIADLIDCELDYNKFLFPKIDHPAEFKDHADYIKKLCYNAAQIKYPELTNEVKERIDYELSVIHKMGYEEYFLIVKDFIDAARKMDVPVGPGRGSAVGSVVAYLLGITSIEPMKYGLFFERFLNPDRIGMPDIDIDFCAEGRGKIIDYVIEKYGRESVAQIITFGTLGAKTVIKDVARVMEVPASVSNEITKLIPPTPRITLDEALKQSREFADKMAEDDLKASILSYSKVLEGLIRHIGVHAAGVVIGPGDLSNYVPLAANSQKGSDLAVLVQYEGRWLDDLKMLKMDFLGLKTLTLIKKTVKLVKESQNIDVDIDHISLSDTASYDILSNAQTDGVFQFESDGMKKYLSSLKPNVFEDLIAMVALYRPGPMQFIDTFINRKHGIEPVTFVHKLTENALRETYGVTVYQEQVMQIAREMGGLSGAEADTLRKAISKKKLKTMELLKVKFVEGSSRNGVQPHVIEKIWTDWLDFANYAFNKSHATAYAYVAFQTAYLKAHYPVEFMAALLSLEQDPAKITNFIEECKAMGIEVIPPNINKSECEFSVHGKKILFGLQAIKNVGTAAIKTIIAERNKDGDYKSIFDFCSRVDTMVANKTTLESLICAGAMDELEGNRAQKYSIIENALDFASGIQSEQKRGQMMLFDAFTDEEEPEKTFTPEMPNISEWTINEKLKLEKSVLGFYWSGHPLNQYKEQLEDLINIDSLRAEKEPEKVPANIAIAGIVSEITKKNGKRNSPFAIIKLEDFTGKFELTLFNDDYDNYLPLMEVGRGVFILGKKSGYTNGNENMLRVVPRKIIKFDELAKHLSGEMSLKIPEAIFTSDFSTKLIELFKQHPGNFNLHINVESDKYKSLNLRPRQLMIFPDKAVKDFFHEISGISHRINLNLS